MKKATRDWVRKAEKDYQFALRNASASEGFYDQICFHFQQSSEKYLKALQEELGLIIRRTHVLKDILAVLLPHHPSLAATRRGMTFLTRFAVDTRYPGDTASKRQAKTAERWAAQIRAQCRGILGLPTSRLRTHP
jgi:HEPN domain-containing protein